MAPALMSLTLTQVSPENLVVFVLELVHCLKYDGLEELKPSLQDVLGVIFIHPECFCHHSFHRCLVVCLVFMWPGSSPVLVCTIQLVTDITDKQHNHQ